MPCDFAGDIEQSGPGQPYATSRNIIVSTTIALVVATSFASASFAQVATPAARTAKVTAPAPTEKKVDAPKAAEPAKLEVAKTEAPKADAGKPITKHGKNKGHRAKTEVKPEAKPAVAPAPAAK